MNRPMLLKLSPKMVPWMAAFLLSTVLAFAPIAPAQDTANSQNMPAANGQRADGQIEMDVVHALDASQALKNDLITAATIQSEVTLSGTVSSQGSKDLAGSIAGQVAGVTKVHNNLKVGDPQTAQNEAAPQPQDAQDATGAVAGAMPQQNNAPYGTQAQQQPNNNQPYGTQAPQQAQPYPGQNPGQYPDQSQYPAQGQYPPPPAQQRPQYGNPQQQQPYPGQPQYSQQQPYPQQPQAPAYQYANGPVTIPQGTLLQLRTSEPLASKKAVDGNPVQFTVIQDVTMGGVLAIPRGAVVHGVVSEIKKSGELGGSPELALTLTSLDLGGQTYPLQSDEFKVKGPNKAGETVGNAVAGGLIGTIIGCAVGRGEGCAIGAGAGVAAGTAATAATPGPGVWIPAEAQVTFHLAAPLTVAPVSPQEAQRLAQGLYPGGPTLYRRPPAYGPYGRPVYAAPYYAYPPVYYRPYYMAGGYYYWR